MEPFSFVLLLQVMIMVVMSEAVGSALGSFISGAAVVFLALLAILGLPILLGYFYFSLSTRDPEPAHRSNAAQHLGPTSVTRPPRIHRVGD
jgi:hypothetical protein